MKKIGIIRPCKIGDLIISLPIGKYYFDKGYDVYWPIMSKYYQMFNEVAGHYIKFIPITNSDFFVLNAAKGELAERKILNILNLTFNIGTFSDLNSIGYAHSKLTFDQYIYLLAEVPFHYKWNLEIKRNLNEEENVFRQFVKDGEYSTCHFEVDYNKYRWQNGEQTRNGYFNLCKNKIKNKIIEISEDKKIKSLFYWIKVLENSDQLFLVDSSPMNLVEALQIKNEKYLLIKALDHPKGTPVTKSNWLFI